MSAKQNHWHLTDLTGQVTDMMVWMMMKSLSILCNLLNRTIRT